MTYEIVCTRGSMKGRRWVVTPQGLKIGRADGCEIRVGDVSAELYHCVVKLVGGKPVVVNLASDNGVDVNGDCVDEAVLGANDVIRIGGERFVILAPNNSKARVPKGAIAVILVGVAVIGAVFCGQKFRGAAKPESTEVSLPAVGEAVKAVATNREVRIVSEEIVSTNRIVRIVDNVVITNYVVEVRRNGELVSTSVFPGEKEDERRDFGFANVAASVSAEGRAIITAKKVLSLEVAGYTGGETLANVPVLVRLSTAIAGFSYADFADANGGDLIFTDEGGSVVYPHEIDEWHANGESLVWVKLPTMVNGMRFKAAYGNAQLSTQNLRLSPHEVWSDYAGVWHMNEDSGTAFDSTAHGLDALPTKGSNALADTSQMVAYENGACGRARVNATTALNHGNYLCVPSYDELGLGGKFVISGWVLCNETPRFMGIVMRNLNRIENGVGYLYADGWGVGTLAKDFGMTFYGATNHILEVRCATPSLIGGWVSFVGIYNETNVYCYINGVCVMNGVVGKVKDNGVPLTFGCVAFGVGRSLNGQYDEIRLRGGSLSSARIKADYDMIKNRNFLRYGPVENGRGAKVEKRR